MCLFLFSLCVKAVKWLFEEKTGDNQRVCSHNTTNSWAFLPRVAENEPSCCFFFKSLDYLLKLHNKWVAWKAERLSVFFLSLLFSLNCHRDLNVALLYSKTLQECFEVAHKLNVVDGERKRGCEQSQKLIFWQDDKDAQIIFFTLCINESDVKHYFLMRWRARRTLNTVERPFKNHTLLCVWQ